MSDYAAAAVVVLLLLLLLLLLLFIVTLEGSSEIYIHNINNQQGGNFEQTVMPQPAFRYVNY